MDEKPTRFKRLLAFAQGSWREFRNTWRGVIADETPEGWGGMVISLFFAAAFVAAIVLLGVLAMRTMCAR